MSNYRDDLIDVITAQATITSKMTIIVNERVATADRLGGKNNDTPSDTLTIMDGIGDGVGVVMGDMVLIISGIAQDKKIRRELVKESLSINDDAHRIYRDGLSDGINIQDITKQTLFAKAVFDEMVGVQDDSVHTIRSHLADSMSISSNMGNNRQISDHLADGVIATDYLAFALRERLTDVLRSHDVAIGKQLGNNPLTATITARDDISEVLMGVMGDTAKVGDGIWDRLTARDNLHERAMIAVIDELICDDDGMAWTMNTVNHAMSQYLPYKVQRLVVIDNILYGECKDGIYRLDGDDETITATLITDKLDYGENLIKPSYAYTEYRTDGNMSLTVHTTQKGIKQSYTYTLPKEQADEMTGGRFVFGRGLYGRHFAYTLTITAKQALLHDLNIHFEPTKRRL